MRDKAIYHSTFVVNDATHLRMIGSRRDIHAGYNQKAPITAICLNTTKLIIHSNYS